MYDGWRRTPSPWRKDFLNLRTTVIWCNIFLILIEKKLWKVFFWTFSGVFFSDNKNFYTASYRGNSLFSFWELFNFIALVNKNWFMVFKILLGSFSLWHEFQIHVMFKSLLVHIPPLSLYELYRKGFKEWKYLFNINKLNCMKLVADSLTALQLMCLSLQCMCVPWRSIPSLIL